MKLSILMLLPFVAFADAKVTLDKPKMVEILKGIDQRIKSPGDYKALFYLEQREKDKPDVVREGIAYRRDVDEKLMILFTKPKTEQGKGSSGFPGLSRLPVIGALFGQQTRTDNRSELVVLITPQVVRDPADARRLTDEYGQRFRALEPLRKEKARNER